MTINSRPTVWQLEERIVEIIAIELKVPIKKVRPTALVSDDLGADSLKAASLLLALEQGLRVTIKRDIDLTTDTVWDLVKVCLLATGLCGSFA